MPLHGKIVVIKRSGGDGTEFPLISTCLIGRRPDCDIRIQLPQVSKEHCRIDLNENKEVILTNLSSVTPTLVNGEALRQSERLKHGDVITVIDHFYPHLKDGTNHDNIQRPLEKTVEVETKEGDGLLQSKTASPFNDLYQMIKKSLDVKTPRKSSASVLQTPTSRKNDGKPVLSTEDKSTPKKEEAKVSPVADETKGEAENVSNGTPKSVKKQRRSFQVPSAEMARPSVGEAENAANSEATSPQKRSRTPPQRFSACEVEPKSPVRRRSKEAEPAVTTEEQEEQAVTPTKTDGLRRSSPRNSGKEASKKRKYGEVAADSPTPQMKRKRVSFGGYLCPELFDKRLPPDSPLCKGATPRRSLCVSKPKQSLLRRASAIGLRQVRLKTPSPKSSKKSPKAMTPSPKAAPPAKKSPKSKSPSPARGRSPTVGVTPGVQTPLIQGRFSVSHISTPSPVAEDAVTDQVPLVTVTPKVPLRRKSMSRETPSTAKSAVKVMRRRSGISRASLKVKNSWADIVRFGPAKPQVAIPAKKMVTKKATKKTVSKPQTPARKLKDHVSTGHADSPVTIVVGRAHKQKALHPTGAAPRLVTNISLLKKNMKMDEDLSGNYLFSILTNGNTCSWECLATSMVEPSVLNTPEEPGEMMVSPLSVSSTVKDSRYNTEAVQRLLNDDQESSIVSDTPAFEIHSDDFSEQQCADLKTTSVTTPKQKPDVPECLTGVKRIMKTPRQKAEPVEDIRGKILKTPKQKPEQQECLTGVKRMMTTPRQETEPVEDIRVELLTTPKQKPEQQQCLSGQTVETPAHIEKAKPVEENSGIKRLVKTPRQSHSAPEEDFGGLQELMEEPLAEPTGQLETNEVITRTMQNKRDSDANEVVVDDHMEEVPSGHNDNESSDAVETISQAAVDENISEEQPTVDAVDEILPEEQPTVDAADEKISGEQPTVDAVDEILPEEQPTVDAVDEILPVEQPTKSVRGRRAKTAEDKREAAEQSEDPVVLAPVRGRRGKKTEAAAPPAVKQTTRGRNAKPQEDKDVELTMEKSASLPPKVALKPRRGRNAKTASDDQPEMGPEKAVETTLVTEIPTEAVSDQTPMKENDSAPPAEEAVLKPVRGRKTKPTPVDPPQPETNEVVINEPLTADAQPPKSIPTLGKSRRGRQTKPDAVERNEVMEDTVVAVETKQQSQPPVRAKRGRNAKQEEEKLESTSVETATSQEPAKKLRRTRKAEQDVEPREVQAIEMVIPEKAEAPLVAEPVPMDEQATVAAKPRRGGRKAKQDPELETPAESTEVQEVPAVNSTDKLKRGRRGKQVTEEVGVTAVVSEEKPDRELEAEEKTIAEPDTPVIKPSRARGVKTSVKNEVSQAIPAKRARRGAAPPLDESSAESTEPAPTSVEPAKRGRRAAAKPTADDATVTGEQPNPAEDSSNAVMEDTKMSKRSVRWKADLEVFDISKVTPVKAVRGRKPKLAVQVDTESKNVSKDANETEEDLSGKVVEAQPVKRARRGAKVADVTTEAESTPTVKSVEADTQPKTRRGRIAKK
uniref:Marker of proliferation Ki-67 n=1 Tax=Sander lucioperca TaxID=283035 RepID=A0A8D0D8T1_SANLU